MMKNIYKLFVFLAVILFTACQDEELVKENEKPVQVGDEIMFGVRAGFEISNPESRTQYGGTENIVDGKEPINWTEGDQVEIYCGEATNGPTAHYTVQTQTDDNGDVITYLVRNGNSSLQWGSNDPHTFYAMYPSSEMFDPNSESNVAKGVGMEGSVVKGIVPIEQSPVTIDSEEKNGVTHYIANPNMNYAYMVAKSTATRDDESVSLNFVPIVTAVKVELSLPESITNDGVTTKPNTINVAYVQIEGKGIAGSFSTDLSKWGNATYPECTNSTEATDFVTLNLWQKEDGEGGNREPLAITAGGSLTFTVFLLPGADINSLKVSFSDGSAGYVGKTLSKENVVLFPKHKKTIINGLQLPVSGFKLNVGNWMSQLDEQTKFNRLSIPGAGSAFSKDGGDGYSAQTLSFDEQWKAGIRAFEIITDRVQGTDFGSEAVRCNGKAVANTTVNSVMSQIAGNLEGTKECAVVIFTYQPSGRNPARDPEAYITNIRTYFKDNYYDKLIKYRPTLTLGEAQGKIIVIVRPSQIDEDTQDERNAALAAVSDETFNIGNKILIVDGCGTAKDKWRIRGYSNNGARSPEQGTYNWRWNTANVEYSIANNSWGTVTKADAEYYYNVNLEDSENYQIWYQEWARVVPDAGTIGDDEAITKFGSYYWRDSYNEKLADVKKTFDMALSGEYDGTVSGKDAYVFVNSLSGFYVSNSYQHSYSPLDPSSIYYQGGSQGDIAGLAQDLNEAFYQYVLSKEDQTGATGIVMMDFVANKLNEDESNKGSYYLPGVIINNNFRFNTVAVPEAPNPDQKPSEPGEDA